MGDYLTNLVARTLGEGTRFGPRLPSVFEPAERVANVSGEREDSNESLPELAQTQTEEPPLSIETSQFEPDSDQPLDEPLTSTDIKRSVHLTALLETPAAVNSNSMAISQASHFVPDTAPIAPTVSAESAGSYPQLSAPTTANPKPFLARSKPLQRKPAATTSVSAPAKTSPQHELVGSESPQYTSTPASILEPLLTSRFERPGVQVLPGDRVLTTDVEGPRRVLPEVVTDQKIEGLPSRPLYAQPVPQRSRRSFRQQREKAIESETSINVTIGRVEVRATPATHNEKRARATTSPVMPLDEYLKTQRRGSA